MKIIDRWLRKNGYIKVTYSGVDTEPEKYLHEIILGVKNDLDSHKSYDRDRFEQIEKNKDSITSRYKEIQELKDISQILLDHLKLKVEADKGSCWGRRILVKDEEADD